MRTVSYIVAVHDEEDVLEPTTVRIAERLRSFPGSEVVLVENGSADSSPALVRRLAADLSSSEVVVKAAESEKGFGHALRRGIEVSSGDVLVLTAADLPFGFSDFDHVAPRFSERELVFGSKGHPDTRFPRPLSRRVLSSGFRLLRRRLLDLSVVDTQGTVLVGGRWARHGAPYLECGDYLVTTELAAFAARDGLCIREVPVTADDMGRRPSSVRPVRDSMRMLQGLIELRKRFADDGPLLATRTLARP